MDPKVKMTHDIPLSICSYRKFICYSFQPKSQISRARGAKVIGTSVNLKFRGLESGALKVHKCLSLGVELCDIHQIPQTLQR